MFAYVNHIVLVALIFSAGVVLAGDGDVDYSAPYITVDPETGQLVTINPGPKLKMHEQMAPTIDTRVAVADATPADATSTTISDAPSYTLSIVVVATLFILIAGLAGWRSKQKRTT